MSLLDNLLLLYRVDAQVRGLKTRVGSAERFLAAQEAKLADIESQKSELESRRRQIQAKAANLETELGSHTARIDKLRAELNEAETNKQYTALLTEVNTVKAMRADVEAQALQHLEQVEELTRELEAIEHHRIERIKQRDVAAAQLEERRHDVGDRLAELEREREIAAAAIPSKELRLFVDLADRYEGEAMAALDAIDVRNKEYACSACNMHVPFQTVASLRGFSDAIVRCSACQRILYLSDEARALAGRK